MEKPVALFHKKKGAYDGLTSDCKACIATMKKRKYAAKKLAAGLNRTGNEDATEDEERGVGRKEEAAVRQP